MMARVETAIIKLTLERDKLSKKDILELERLFVVPHTKKGDTLHITYEFEIEYLGGIVARFEAIINLFAKASIVKVNTEELRHGKCLAQELLCKIEQIEQKYGEGAKE